MSNSIHLLIADDSRAARTGLKGLLTSVSDIRLVGEAAGGEEAMHLAERLQPDIILMDLHMPDVNGIDATSPSPNNSRSALRPCATTPPIFSPSCKKPIARALFSRRGTQGWGSQSNTRHTSSIYPFTLFLRQAYNLGASEE